MNGGTVSFSDDLKAAKTAQVPFEDVSVLVNNHAHTLRFRQMNGFDWALAIDRHPARPDAAFDSQKGYNIRSLIFDVAPKSGVLLEDGAETELQVDPVAPGMTAEQIAERKDEWSDLLSSLNGHDFESITDAIWRLNDASPARALTEAVEQVKKARPRSSKASA